MVNNNNNLVFLEKYTFMIVFGELIVTNLMIIMYVLINKLD